MADGERLTRINLQWDLIEADEGLKYIASNADEVWRDIFTQMMDLEEGLVLDAIVTALRDKGYTVVAP